jgi:hypothetical protein
MTYAPITNDELDPIDAHLTSQRYCFRYCDLCHQLGLKSHGLSEEEVRNIDYHVAQAARKQGITDNDIELIIGYGSDLARRLDDTDRDIYSRSFTVEVVEDDQPPEPTTTFVDSKGNAIDPWETYAVPYGFPS